MRIVFSTLFKADLDREKSKYEDISVELAKSFAVRVAEQTQAIIKAGGGDHVGPHGFPCRSTKPFPHYIYYKSEDNTLYFLALVHERRHPDFLKNKT